MGLTHFGLHLGVEAVIKTEAGERLSRLSFRKVDWSVNVSFRTFAVNVFALKLFYLLAQRKSSITLHSCSLFIIQPHSGLTHRTLV